MDPVHVQPGTVEPLVRKCFDRVSTVQWTMLADGTWESSTLVLLADMCTEIVQALSVHVLRHLVPVLRGQLPKASQLQQLMSSLSVNLGDVIPRSFAAALNVAPQPCKDAAELTSFMEGEVLQKVNFALSAAVTANVSQPILYVSSTMWSFGSLYVMICHMTRCLRRLLSDSEQSCAQCWQKNRALRRAGASGAVATPVVNCGINVSSASKTVTQILLELSPEDELSSPTRSLDAQVTAAQIVDLVMKDIHRVGDGAKSPPPHFNLSVILDVVKQFFSTHQRRSLSQSDCKQRFLHFAAGQFERMTEQLKVMVQREDNNVLIDMRPPRSSPLTVAASGTIQIKRWALSWRPIFDEIQPQVETVFNKLTCPINPSGDVCYILKSICDEIRLFSRELSCQLFNHMGEGQMELRGALPQERRALDSVLSDNTRKMDEAGLSISAEYLYVMTEDVVGRFLQQLLLWLQVESSHKMAPAEKVSDALSSITKHMMTLLSLPTTLSRNSSRSDESLLQKRRSQSTSASSASCSEEDCAVREHVDSLLVCNRAVPYPDPSPACPDSPAADSESSEASSRGLVSHFVGALIMELVTQLPWESRKLLLMNTIQLVTKHLSDYAIEHMRVTEPLRENYSLKKVVKSVARDLLGQFTSLEELIETLMTQPDLFFYNHLVVCLKDHLGSLYTPRSRGKAERFVSAITRAFANPPCF